MGMEKKRPILSVRPKFDPGLTMIQALAVTLVGFLVTTFVFGSFVFILLMMIGLSRHISAGGIYGFFLVVSLLGIPPLFFEIKKRAFQRTIYNFYDDYLDFQYFHNFINRRRGRIRYTDIVDIAQHASALQDHQRLTTIYIYVPGMGMGTRGGFAGVKLVDLPQAKDYMTKIMDLLEGRTPAAAPQPVAAEAAQPPIAPQPDAPQAPATPAAPPPVTES